MKECYDFIIWQKESYVKCNYASLWMSHRRIAVNRGEDGQGVCGKGLKICVASVIIVREEFSGSGRMLIGNITEVPMKRNGNAGREKSWMQRILSMGLALALAAGLCACGGSGENGGAGGEGNGSLPVDSEADVDESSARPGGSTGNAAGAGSAGAAGEGGTGVPGNANSVLAKENVYRVREIEIPKLAEADRISVKSLTRLDGGICAVMEIYDFDNGHKYYRFTTDEDGNVLKTALLEKPEDAEPELSGDGGSGQAGNGASGQSGDGESGQPGDGGSDAPGGGEGQSKTAPEPDPNVWEREEIRYSDFVTGADGRTYGLRQYKYSYINQLTGQSLEEQHQYVCCWDGEGSLLWQSEPCGDSVETLSVWAIFPAADGSLELLLTGENAYRLSIGEGGVLSETEPERLSDATGKALETCRRLLRREDGTCLLLCRNADGSLGLTEYDTRTDTLGESVRLPDDLTAGASSSTVFAAGKSRSLIYADRNGVFSWEMGDLQGSLKMDYVNSDRMITEVGSFLELDETHFCMFFREDYGRELKAGIFEYVRPEDIPDKTVVLLGGLTVNGGIKQRAVQYNRESERYRVVLKEYPSAADLNLEIIAGRMPDILVTERLPEGDPIPMESYIAKGMIADVGKLIEADAGLSGTDFLTNVFEAYSVDGRLMYVVPSFTVLTMAARASHVGDGSGWSMERMREVLEAMGSRARLLDGLDRETFMEKLLEYRGNDFIDLKTGKCAFDSPEFIEIMKFAGTLPEERHYASESGEDLYELQYLKDRTLLKELSIWTFIQNVDERLFYQLNGYLGGEYTFVGFPGSAGNAAESGNGAAGSAVNGSDANGTDTGGKDVVGKETAGSGALIRGHNLMALSALSENQEGAWDFARYYLTEEYQRSLESSLPVNRQIFEEWALEETRRSYYMDENGKKTEYDLTLWLDGKEITVEPFSKEQLDELIAYVESVTTIPFEDENVLNIIREEMGSYFSGQKKAEDVAAVIQSRVQMYVQENQ